MLETIECPRCHATVTEMVCEIPQIFVCRHCSIALHAPDVNQKFVLVEPYDEGKAA